MPVSPAITEGSQAPEGVAENTMPSLSMASTQVVSLRHQSVVDLGVRDVHLRGMLARLAVDQCPGRKSREACVPISLRRSAAYSFDSSVSGGNLVELGIAVVGVAIRVGQLQRFHQRCECTRRSCSRMRAQIVAFQDVQRLQHGRTLAPESRLVNLVAAIVGRDRLFGLQLECGHVLVAQQAVVGLA